MAINISPAGLTAAAVPNELRVTAIIKERLCNAYCINAEMLPQATVTYTTGTPRLRGTALFIPIKAVVSIVTRGCGCQAKTYLFNEQTEVSFSDATALPTSVTLTVQGSDVQPAFVNCTRANGVQIADSLLITIVPAAAPAA